MRLLIRNSIFLSLLANSPLCFGTCLPIHEAQNHIGETRCVTGKVLKVEQGDKGVHFLNFCENRDACPFTVVVFPSDLRYVGDVRQLEGKIVEIHGPVTTYDNRAEIILSSARQLKGESSQIPPLPKNYDVEKKGRYSAGTFSRPKPAKATPKRSQTKPIPPNDPSDPSSSLE